MPYTNAIKSSTPGGIPKQSLIITTITLSSETKKFAESSKLCLLT